MRKKPVTVTKRFISPSHAIAFAATLKQSTITEEIEVCFGVEWVIRVVTGIK